MLKILKLRINMKVFWFITYLSVFLLPFIVCSYTYIDTYRMLKTGVSNNNVILLEQIKNIVDNYISDFNKMSIAFQFNERVKTISYAKKPLKYEQHYVLNQLRQEINSFVLANNIIKDIYIHFTNTDIIVNSRSTYTMDLIQHLDNEDLVLKEWKTIFRKMNGTNYSIFNSPEFSTSFLSRYLVYFDTKKPLSTIAIVFNEDFLMNHIKINLLSKNTYLCILDTDNQIILSTDNSLNQIFDFSTFTVFADPTEYFDKKNNKYVVSIIKSDVSDWRYVSIVPTSVFNAELNHTVKILLLNLATCVILGLFIIHFYSKMNYTPLKTILSYSRTSPSSISIRNNEYGIILKTLRDNDIKLNQVMQNSILTKILKGELSVLNSGIIEKLKIQFELDDFAIAIIRICNPGTLLSEDEGVSMQQSLLKFSICNVFEELVHPFYFYLSCVIDMDIVYIVNKRNKNIDTLSKLDELLKQAIQFFRDTYNTHLLAGFSDKSVGYNQLSHSYSQAVEACEYIQIFESSDTLCYKDILINTPSNESVTYDSRQLLNLVASGNVEEVKKVLHTYFDNISMKNRSIYEVKYFKFFFHRTLMKIDSFLHQKYSQDCLNITDEINEFLVSSSLNYTIRLIENIFVSITQYIAEGTCKSSDIYIDIMRYIDNHYTDLDLNITTIADEFHFTPPYLSKKFKDSTGISIIDYIYQVRIIQAKKMIKETNLKISDIAQKVGFTDSNAFIRIFKRLEGITPGAFKDI